MSDDYDYEKLREGIDRLCAAVIDRQRWDFPIEDLRDELKAAAKRLAGKAEARREAGPEPHR